MDTTQRSSIRHPATSPRLATALAAALALALPRCADLAGDPGADGSGASDVTASGPGEGPQAPSLGARPAGESAAARGALSAAGVPCTSDTDCDDGAPCTQDICDQKTGGCYHAKLQGACCGPEDCPPKDKCHDATCDSDTALCVQTPIPGAQCCTVSADCPTPVAPCDEAYCYKGACHPVTIKECCTDDSQCDDKMICTDNLCDLATNRCVFPFKAGGEGETCYPCFYHSQCNDGNGCTFDLCVDYHCEHVPIPDCCQYIGAINGAECDDGDPCNIDQCTPVGCKHFPTGTLGPDVAPPVDCCSTPADCAADDPCSVASCEDGACVWAPVFGCEALVPHLYPFTTMPGAAMAEVWYLLLHAVDP